jgi:hypothetical protein
MVLGMDGWKTYFSLRLFIWTSQVLLLSLLLLLSVYYGVTWDIVHDQTLESK